MNKHELLTAVTVAVGTAALTITAFWPDSLDAGDDPVALAPKISRPTLVANGVEFTLKPADDRNFSAGEEPVLELAALNTNSTPARATVHLAMSATSPADALSRVVRTPSLLWQTDQAVALAPGESKTIVLQIGTKLPPNNLISILLQDTGAAAQSPALDTAPVNGLKAMRITAPGAITALSFSTVVPRKDQSIATIQAGARTSVRSNNQALEGFAGGRDSSSDLAAD
ncbi:MAG TPA: hypothetical protein VJA21_13850 [Verrucomicrobiae bacterium]